jgi:hypothetical protein
MTEEERKRIQAIERYEANRATLKSSAEAEYERRRKADLQSEIEKADRRLTEKDLSWGETFQDIDRSAGVGAMKGVTGAPGAPIDIIRMGQLARAYTTGGRLNPMTYLSPPDPKYFNKSTEEILAIQDEERKRGERGYLGDPAEMMRWGGEAWQKTLMPYVSEEQASYKPKTRAGEVAQTFGEVTGGGIAGDAPLVAQSAARFGPHAAIRQFGQSVRDSTLTGGAVAGAAAATNDNPAAMLAAGVLAGPAARYRGSTTVEDAMRTRGGTPTQAQLHQAENLFNRARLEGIPLTRANAIDWVTGGEAQGLSELQRIIESSGSPELRRFFRENSPPGPTRVRAYGERVLDQIGPESTSPSTIGPRVAEQSDLAVKEAERLANADVRPQYQALESRRADPQEFQRLMADPAWARAYEQVMTEPDYAAFVRGLPPDSAGVIDLVTRVLEHRREGFQTPGGNPEGISGTRAGGLVGSGQESQRVASEASMPGAPGPAFPGIRTPLEEAQYQRALNQQTLVDPLSQGPTGQMAQAKTTQAAEGAAFPSKPLEGSQYEVGHAVHELAARDPNLAREYVRNYLGTQFNAQTGRNVGGEPYTAGTKFWKGVAGNDQQTQNLQAAVEALPNGREVWQAVREMGNIFEAMGKRQHPGSKTAFNEQDLKEIGSETGLVSSAAQLYGLNFSVLGKKVSDAVERYRLGQNKEEIARLLTDPGAGREFANILRETPPGSAERAIRMARVLAGSVTQAGTIARPIVESPLYAPSENRP